MYSYDSSQNRLQMMVMSNSTTTTSYVYNNLNQLTVSSTNGMETLYSYDSNGNLLSKGTTSFIWNKDDQLIAAIIGNDTVTYLYDTLGRRTQRIQGTSTTDYQLEGLDTQVELANSSTQRIYTLSGGAVGQIISVRYNNIDYFYHYDALGNVLFISDSNGDIVTAYTQEGFGNVLATLGNLPNPLHLTTKEQDPLTGLYYFGARWYDPQAGRWISKEPLGLDGPNLYQYTFNNPINGFDPNGLATVLATWSNWVDIKGIQNKLDKFSEKGILQNCIGTATKTGITVSGAEMVQEAGTTLGTPSASIGQKTIALGKLGLVSIGWLGGASALAKGLGLLEKTGATAATEVEASVAAEATASAAEDAATNTGKFFDIVEEYLGKDYEVIKPCKTAMNRPKSDLILQSKNGLRQVRFDISNPTPHNYPHIDIQEWDALSKKPGWDTIKVIRLK